jgi:hypothetical protein
MRTIQKAGAFALILTAKCLREALSTLADLREGADPRQDGETEIRALRSQLESMNASIEEIKESLRPTDAWDNSLVQ